MRRKSRAPVQGLVALFAAACVFAADPWQSKPFTEWTDKEISKILANSPWARPVSVALGGPGAESGGRGRRGGGGGIAGADEIPARPGGDDLAGPGGGAPGGNVASREYGGGVAPSVPTLQLVVRWQSAIPIKQALIRRKFGSEAATSPDAKKFLDDNPGYLIVVSGLPATISRGLSPQIRMAIRQQTTLSVKGKPGLQPTGIDMGPPGPTMDLFFLFPRSAEFTLADKEVEFSTNLGPLAVKQKFRLKDMAINGALQL